VKTLDVVLLTIYAPGLSVGQMLFKPAVAANSPATASAGVSGLVRSPAFVSGAVLYVVLMFHWTWLLTRIPLTRAYPAVALCFVPGSPIRGLVFR